MKRSLSLALIFGAGGVVLHLAGLLLVDVSFVQKATPPGGRVAAFSASIAPPGSILASRENRLLNDSSPLFMPTRWNLASNLEGVASLREATEVFDPYAARINLPREPQWMNPFSSDDALLPPESFLPQGSAFVLSSLGRGNGSSENLSPAPPPVVAVNLEAVSDALPTRSELPQSLLASAPQGLWEPFQCLLGLAEGKPTGVPLQEKSSGNAAWDEVLKRYLQSLDYYRMLEDGYYRITIFP